MQDPYAPVEAGTTGKLDYIDDAGQFHMKWDNGRTLALIPGVDSFTVLPPELSMTKLYMPLTAELYEPDVYGNMQEEPELLTGHDLTAYEDHIRSALVKYRMPEEVNRGIMHWYDAADSVNDKVRSVTFSVERSKNMLQIIKNALNTVRLDPDHGELMYQILYLTYFSERKLANREAILAELERIGFQMSMVTYHSYLNMAIKAIDRILWGYTARDCMEIIKQFLP